MEIDRLIDVLLALPETNDPLTVYTAKGIAARMRRVNAVVRGVMDDLYDETDAMVRERAMLRDDCIVAAILDKGPTHEADSPTLREAANG